MRAVEIAEVRDQNVKRNVFAILYVVINLLLFILWVGDIVLYKGQSRQLDLFSLRMSDFLADFLNTTGYCAFRSPYDNIAYANFLHKQYPPFAYVFFWLFSKFSWKMESYYTTNRFMEMYQEPFFLFMLFLVFIICGIVVFELVRKNTVGPQVLQYGVASSVILSLPMFYTIERGNNTLFAAIFTMVYLFEYDSDNKYKREIALISLAAAAATKLVPAVFGVLLLYEKRWKDALRAVAYGIILGVLPFFMFDGGIQYNLPLWIRNARMAVKGHSPFDGCSLAAVISGFLPHYRDNETIKLTILIASYACCALLLLTAPIYRRRWEKVLAVSIAVLSLQGQSWDYCLLYLIPFVIMFLNEEEFSLKAIFVWAAIVLMMSPYMLFSHAVRSRIFVCVYMFWLLIEGLTLTMRRLPSKLLR